MPKKRDWTMKLALYFPWNNLGCLGIRIGGFYADVFIKPYFGYCYTTVRKGVHTVRRRRIW